MEDCSKELQATPYQTLVKTLQLIFAPENCVDCSGLVMVLMIFLDPYCWSTPK